MHLSYQRRIGRAPRPDIARFPPRRTSLMMPAFLLLWGLLSGCEIIIDYDDYDDGYCDGRPEVGYDIPNITLVANAERYIRILEADPEVFYHTGGEYLSYDAYTSNSRIAEAYVDNSDGVLTVIPKRPGRARITIEAEDDCGSRIKIRFTVEVIRAGTAP